MLRIGNAVIATILGGTLPPAKGNSFSPITNCRDDIDSGGVAGWVAGLRFVSTPAALKFDDIAGQGGLERAR